MFLQRIADAQDTAFRDLDASAWQRLFDRARDGRVYDAGLIERRAGRKLRDVIARRAKK